MRFLLKVLVFTLPLCLAAPGVRAGLDLRYGDVVVADQDDNGSPDPNGKLIRVDPVTGAQTLIASGGLLADPSDVVVDAAGRLWVADYSSGGGGALIRVDPRTGIQTVGTRSSLPGKPTAVGLDAAGNVYVGTTDDFNKSVAIVRVDPASGVQTVVSSGGRLFFPEHIEFDRAGNLLVSDAQGRGGGQGTVFRIDPVTGEQSFAARPGLRIVIGLALEPSGEMLVSHHDYPELPRISRVDPVTGDVMTVSDAGLLKLTGKLAMDSAGRLLAADLDAIDGKGAVIAIDRATGAQSVLSSGGMFFNPTGIAVVVPEPGAVAGVVFASALLLRRRRVSRGC